MINSRRTLDPNTVYTTTRSGIVSIYVNDKRVFRIRETDHALLDMPLFNLTSNPYEVWDVWELLELASSRTLH